MTDLALERFPQKRCRPRDVVVRPGQLSHHKPALTPAGGPGGHHGGRPVQIKVAEVDAALHAAHGNDARRTVLDISATHGRWSRVRTSARAVDRVVFQDYHATRSPPSQAVRCNEPPLPGDFVLVAYRALPGEPGPIPVEATRWAAGLPPGAWPTGFASTGKVWRTEVFALAERWRAREVSSVQLAAGVLGWGHGIRGYGPFRSGRILAQERAGELLEAALGELRSDAVTPAVLESCYERFTTTAKLPGLGAAFFTKLLYFAGYRRGRGGIQPLILDRVVADRLPASAGPAGKYRTAWWTGTWLAYLHWAADQSTRPEFDHEPDLVEMAIFAGSWSP